MKIPKNIAAEVQFKSNRKCCVCKANGVHVHHIDGNNKNNKFDNLALLCFICHDEATKTGSLSRKLDGTTIKKFRKDWYETVELQRKQAKGIPSKTKGAPSKSVKESDLLQASLNANIVLEVGKMKIEYLNAKLNERTLVLDKLQVYIQYNNITVATQVLDFLEEVAQRTRADKSEDIAFGIYAYMLEFFLSHDNNRKTKEIVELGKTASYIGFCVAYDGAIHCRNMSIFAEGLEILKHIYDEAISNKSPLVKNEVLEQFNSLKSTLKRPERKDLGNARKILDAFIQRLDIDGAVIDSLPYELFILINPGIDQ